MDRQIQYQMRELPSAYPVIDIISAAFAKLGQSGLSKNERQVLQKYHSFINQFNELENSRKTAVENLSSAAFSGNFLSVWFLLKKIAWLDRKIAKLEEYIIFSESDPALQRVFAVGNKCLSKNPDMKEEYNRLSERYSQNHLISVVKDMLK